MTRHERAVEVAASQDDVFRLLADRHRMHTYFPMITAVRDHGPDSVTITTADRDGVSRESLLRLFADGDEMHIAWELDDPRIRGEIVVAPGPDLEGWNHCIVSAIVDDEHWPGIPASAEARTGYLRAPGVFGGTPGREGMALGRAGSGGGMAGPTTLVDPVTGDVIVPGEALERGLAQLRDHLSALAHRT
ncbi:SRPBCC family protein [Yinghuangia soli]|uniref:SRPBCC family protein n=1 Tax=Yinghuangia soli TaxID=2908204 RepID=A0AA41U1H6_9ACTN|nr:SRPBCC family protein [Yinghuangia soli]MCF2529636.1 SRPBCC family protein [Yinghuangia soli]